MWRDTFLFDQPFQHRSCPVSGIPDKPLRLEAEALLCSLDHGLRRTDLGLANGATTTVVDNGTFKTKTEAGTGMKTTKICTE